MTFLPSLPEDARLLDVFKKFPETSRALIAYHEPLMRGPSPFSVAERELIAAYVSGLNACAYCHGVHTAVAEAYGIDGGLLGELVADVDAAPVDERMRPVLRYVQKLTLTPSRMTLADAEAVFDAGWEEQALHDAVSICALFNFMNRLVDGLGIAANPDYAAMAGQRLKAGGYVGLLDLIDGD